MFVFPLLLRYFFRCFFLPFFHVCPTFKLYPSGLFSFYLIIYFNFTMGRGPSLRERAGGPKTYWILPRAARLPLYIHYYVSAHCHGSWWSLVYRSYRRMS